MLHLLNALSGVCLLNAMNVVMCICQQMNLDMSTDQGMHFCGMPYGSEVQRGQQQSDITSEIPTNNSFHGQYSNN